jgi:hypothetical protein
MKASLELSGLDKEAYKIDIEQLEIEVAENQMAMLGDGQGQGGPEQGDTEEGRYNGDGSYVDTDLGTNEQGSAQSKNDPREPAIDEEQYKKAGGQDHAVTSSHIGKKVVLGEHRGAKVVEPPKKYKTWERPDEPSGGTTTGHQSHFQGGVFKANIKSNGKKDTREDMDYPPKELHMGISEEMEHTDDEEIAKQIAKDHLDEDPEYYSKLLRAMRPIKKAIVGDETPGNVIHYVD